MGKKLSDEKKEANKFFRIAEQNRELLSKIHVVIPVRPADGINVELAKCLSLWYGEGISWSYLADHMGGFIECTRANISHTFKEESDCEYLLMIDNDMVPPLELPYLLARHKEAVVGSCAMGVSAKFGPMLCFTKEDKEGNQRFVTAMYEDDGEIKDTLIPKKGLLEVSHVGTGAMMVRRDVVESFDYEPGDIPFYVPEEIRSKGFKTGVLLKGEDIVFCEQVQKKGFKVYVDLEAHCGHQKQIALKWDDSKRDPSLSASRWHAPSTGMIIGGKTEDR